MQINWLFFGFYFFATATLHVIHVFLADPFITSSTYLFATYTLSQCALETGILILCASWVKRSFPRWKTFYILAVFLLFLTHFIAFPLERFGDMSFWDALQRFVLRETFTNFVELLLASNIPIFIWILMGLGGSLLMLSGLVLYRFTNQWEKSFHLSRFFLVLSLICLSLIYMDYHINTTHSLVCLDRLKRVLPWKGNFFSADHPTLLLENSLQSIDSEEELLSHLDSRAFSLVHRPDIYLFVVESLRNDFITAEITPHLHQFKEANVSFQTAFSNANGTHLSWYSIFHSRFPFDWEKESLEKEKKGSLPLRLLKKMGYKIHVCSSARLHFYQMNTILFGEGEYLADSLFMPEESFDEPYLKDSAVIDHLITEMQKPGSGRIFITFLDGTHFDYSWPREVSPFVPYQEPLNYVGALFSKTCPQPLINRYRNALHFIDSLFGKVSEALETAPGGQEAAVVFTGDHGEEFFEQGNLFHISGLSYQQITPPLYYRFGKNTSIKDRVQCKTTCHMDIFPTLFQYLLGEDVMHSVLQGQSIFRKDRWPYTLIARFNAGHTPFEYCIHNDENKLTFEFSNDADPFASKELRILSTKNLHDDILSQDAEALQEEFGPALKHLFPSRVQ